MSDRASLSGYRRWVIKIGSSLITADGRGLDTEQLPRWVAQVANLVDKGCDVVVVSSGSIAEGMARLGWRQRPNTLNRLQAAASIGQAGLVEAYSSCFQTHGLRSAQVLLTHDDVADRKRYLNARSTLNTLLAMRAVPIVNENDAVATEQIRVGDNDTMAALVANLLDADGLILLTDQPGFFDRDPRTSDRAVCLDECDVDDPALTTMAGAGSGALGRGGMATKLSAARQAARAGASTVIADGRAPDVINRIVRGEPVGTWLTNRGRKAHAARKNWIAGQRQVRGQVRIDAGAATVLRQAGRSLLPVGVESVSGQFSRGDLVSCIDPKGAEVARGLANYSAIEARRLCGLASEQIAEELGYASDPEFIHRDNLTLSSS